MLVYVAEMVLSYLVYGPWKDPTGYNFPQTITFAAATKVPRLIDGFARQHRRADRAGARWRWRGCSCSAPTAASRCRWAAWRRRRRATPASRRARALWIALLISGGLAGLAGALEAAGPLGQLTPYVPAGYGFAAIIVAFVGRLHPVGMVFAGILMSMFYIGGELAQSRLGLPKSLTGVFQGLLLFALLACDTLIHYRIRWRGAPRAHAPSATMPVTPAAAKEA